MGKFSARKRLNRLKEFDRELEAVTLQKKESTLYDYVKWVADVGFETMPLKEADALVLCVIAYFDLQPAFNEFGPEPTLSDCSLLVRTGAIKLKITGGDMGNTRIMEEACKSRRYGSLKLKDYVDIASRNPPVQFSCVTFECGNLFSFIAYRGTDSSIAGWKENFMISFTHTEAQELAEKYAAEHVKVGRDWYIAGHSKGGNLALVAATNLLDLQMKYVKRVFMLDGPGVCPEVIDPLKISRIEHLITRIIPEFDVIGKLFEPRITDTKIVKSFREGITQHSLASWMIDHGELALLPKNDPSCEWINELLGNWIAGLDISGRQSFVDELFDALSVDGVTDLAEISPEYLGNLIISLKGKSKDTKKTLGSLPKRIIFDDILKGSNSDAPETLKHLELLTAAALCAGGIIMAAASKSILEVATVALIVILICLELFIIVRRLIMDHGRSEGIKERIIITLGLAALLTVLFVKENALFILGSTLFGILFLGLGFSAIDRFRKEMRTFFKVLNIVEFVLAVAAGICFLVFSRNLIRWASLVSGILMITDAVLRFVLLGVRFVYSKVRMKTKKKDRE